MDPSSMNPPLPRNVPTTLRAGHTSGPGTTSLRCPSCGKGLRAPQGLKARTKVLCLNCDHIFRLGETKPSVAPSAHVEAAKPDAPHQCGKPASLAAPFIPDLPASKADPAGCGSERASELSRRRIGLKSASLGVLGLLVVLLAAFAARSTEESDVQQAIACWAGTSGHVDHEKAHNLLTKAANTGDPVAKMWMALFMNAGQCGFARDPSHAFQLASSVVGEVTTRSRQGDANALFVLGAAEQFDLVLNGTHTSGFEKIRESAALGFPDALNNLGECYRFGRGTNKVPAKAVAVYRQAADLGHVLAQTNLAWCYAQGFGVEQDQKQADAWYAKAAKRGDEWSQQYLAGLNQASSDEGPYAESYNGSSYTYDAPTYTTTPSYQSPTYSSYQSPAYSSYQSPSYGSSNSGSYLDDYTRNAAQTMHTNQYTYGSNSTNGTR